VACANQRCDQENVIEQLKNGINALRVPLYDLVSNWAHMVIAALAWNIKSWFAMIMHLKTRPQRLHPHGVSTLPQQWSFALSHWFRRRRQACPIARR